MYIIEYKEKKGGINIKKIIVRLFLIILTSNTGLNVFANNINSINDSDILDYWIINKTVLPKGKDNTTASTVDGKIYIFGDYDTATLDIYDIETNTWSSGTDMPTPRKNLESVVVNGKIYCIGGAERVYPSTKLEIYDPKTDTWSTGANMPTARKRFTATVVGEKIYCIGGTTRYENTAYNNVEVYNTKTNTWSTETSMPTDRWGMVSASLDNKIYVVGGFDADGNPLSTVEIYDVNSKEWSTGSDMPTARNRFVSALIENKLYCIGGYNNSSFLNKVEIYDIPNNQWSTGINAPFSKGDMIVSSTEDSIYIFGGGNRNNWKNNQVYILTKKTEYIIAQEAVDKAEQSKNAVDIDSARELVNQLLEGDLKQALQDRLDAIIPNLTLDIKNATANLDIYIKSENSLHMALSTNQISFDNYSGVDEIEKTNALNISINSSLPYQLNAYLVDEIKNADGTNKIDIDRLQIKDNTNTDGEYKEFTAINEKLVLKDDCEAGNNKEHNIDTMLKGGDAYPADIYKTVIKFEAEQK